MADDNRTTIEEVVIARREPAQGNDAMTSDQLMPPGSAAWECETAARPTGWKISPR